MTSPYRLKCLVKDLPKDRDIPASLFGSSVASEVGIHAPTDGDSFTNQNGEKITIHGLQTGKPSLHVNPEDLTLEERVRAIKGEFPWGPVKEVHIIGDYQIVEFHPRVFKNGHGTSEYSESTSFSAYIGWHSISRSYDTLDEALVGLIAYKHDGNNSSAAEYFMRMIGATTVEG